MGLIRFVVILCLICRLFGDPCKPGDEGDKSATCEDGVPILENIQVTENPDISDRMPLSQSDRPRARFPRALCTSILTCEICIRDRHSYCAWNRHSAACVNSFEVPRQQRWMMVQSIDGCPSVSYHPPPSSYECVTVKPGSTAELLCLGNSNQDQVMWRSDSLALTKDSHFQRIGDSLLIDNVTLEDQGNYECWSEEYDPIAQRTFSRLLGGFFLALDLSPIAPPQPDEVTTPSPTPNTTAPAPPPPVVVVVVLVGFVRY